MRVVKVQSFRLADDHQSKASHNPGALIRAPTSSCDVSTIFGNNTTNFGDLDVCNRHAITFWRQK